MHNLRRDFVIHLSGKQTYLDFHKSSHLELRDCWLKEQCTHNAIHSGIGVVEAAPGMR